MVHSWISGGLHRHVLLLITLSPLGSYAQTNVSATVTSAPTTTAQPSDPYCSDWIDVNGFPNHKCSYPGFIRPSENNQACDLWGPLCQTGTIKVDVNLTSTITPTTVPCSVYLSAQSYSFTTSLIQYYYLSTKDTATYLPSFGHSPQCTSFVNLIRQRPETLSFSNCGSNQDTKSFYKQFPAGVDMSNNDVPTQWNCCGLSNCVFDASPIELFYFPGQEEAQCVRTTVSGKVTRVTDANLNGTTTAKAALPSGGALGSIAVVDGFTYTSPSVYVQFKGTAKMKDHCGTVGPILTKPTLAVQLSELKTMSFYYTLGQTYRPQNLFVGYTTGSLNLDDLACPTWGLSDPMTNVFTQGGSVYTDIYRTIGPPFFPIIVPHSEVLNLNTEWASSCTTIIDNVEGQSVTYGLNDPPHPLTAQPPLSVPASNPAPDPTPTAIPQTTKGSDTTMFDPSTASNLGPPQPQSTPSPDGPRPTNQAPNPPANGDPGSNTPPVNSGGGGSGGGSNQNPSPGQQPNPGGIGGIIISMFDPPPYRPVPPQTIGLPSQLPPDSPPLTLTTAVNGHDYTFTILPTAPGSGSNDGGLAVPGVPSEPGHPAVIVDGSTISQGGPPVTLSDGSVMSVGNDGKLVATPGSGTGGTRTVTTNGQTFTLISGPGGPGETVLVGGQTMTRGGSGVTVDGNSYSVNGGGDLIVASASGSLQIASSAATLEISWHWIGTCITGWFAWTIL